MKYAMLLFWKKWCKKEIIEPVMFEQAVIDKDTETKSTLYSLTNLMDMQYSKCINSQKWEG